MSKLKLTISHWNNGIWGNRNFFFKTFLEAKNEAKKHKGRVKIYNEQKQVVLSEENENNGIYS